MTLFRSLNQRYEQEEALEGQKAPMWPGVFRDTLPEVNWEQFAFQIGIEGQHAKVMKWKQVLTLPSFNENRRITSRAGWTYYGHWRGLTFHTLFSLFSTPQLYPWVKLESMSGELAVIERAALNNYRVITECEGQSLSPLYGGPLWLLCFDHYIEYSFPHLQSITLMQGDYEPVFPFQKLGFDLADARVKPGRYYAIHHEKMATL